MLNDSRSTVTIDTLLDMLYAVHAECQAATVKVQKPIATFLKRFDQVIEQIRGMRISKDDFEIIKVIGRGAYGEVQLVRHKRTRQVYALKRLSKCEMLKRAESAFFWEERDIMTQAQSEWIVSMQYAFQDAQFLYMAMEYMAGGDLVTLQENYDFPENWARFYTAELLLALDAIHAMGYVHRDVKPDNLLIDATGHIKLADFGTCIKLDAKGMVNSDSAVGTPDYIAPEVLESQDGKGQYGKECDWWSVGIFLYELLCGDTPFYCESLLGTYAKIMAHTPEKLKFPEGVTISEEAQDLLRRLLCRRDTRIGSGPDGVEEIKRHPFFKSIDWATIRLSTAPVTPDISSNIDTSNFPVVEPREQPIELFKVERTFTGNQLPFVGFTFSREKLGVRPHGSLDFDRGSSTFDVKDAGERAALAATVTALKRELGDARQQCTHLAFQKDDLEKQLASLTTLERTRTEQEASRMTAISEIDRRELQTQLDKAQQSKLELQQELARLTEKFDALRGAQAKADEHAEQAARATNDAAQAQALLRAEQEKMTTFRAALAQFEASQSEQQCELEEFKRKLEQSNRARRNAEGELDDAKAQLEAQLKINKRNARHIDDLEDQVAELQNTTSEARPAVDAGAVTALEEQVVRLNADVKRRDEELLGMHGNVAALETQLKQAQAKAESSTKEKQALQATSDEKARLEQVIAKLEGQLAQTSTEHSTATAMLAQATKALDEAREENAVLQRRKKLPKRVSVEGMSDDVGVLQSSLEAERQRVQALTTRADALEEESKATATHTERLKSQLREEEKAYEDLSSLVAELRKAAATLQVSHQHCGSTIYELRTQLAASEQRVATAEAALANTESSARLESRVAAIAALEQELAELRSKHTAQAALLDEATTKASQLSTQAERLRIEAEHTSATHTAALEAKDKMLAQVTETSARSAAELSDLQTKLIATSAEAEENKRVNHELLTNLNEKNAAMELELKEALDRTASMQRNLELQVLKTQLAVQKLNVLAKGEVGQPLETTLAAAKKRDTKKPELENHRLQKEVKGWELKYKKLQEKYDRETKEHQEMIEHLNEDSSLRLARLNEEMRAEVSRVHDELIRTKAQLDAASAELASVTQAMHAIQADPTLRAQVERSPARVAMRRSLSFAEANEGWLRMPNKGNVKKNGWTTYYAVLGPDSLMLFLDSMKKEDPEYILEVGTLHNVHPVQHADFHHANAVDIPKIFKLVVVSLHRGPTQSSISRSSSMINRNEAEARPRLSTGTLRPVAKVADTHNINGHLFERQTLKKEKEKDKDKFCNLCQKAISVTSLFGKAQAFECRYCHMLTHTKHFDQEGDVNIGACLGEVEINEFFFQAESEAEQKRWVSKLTTAIKARGERVYARGQSEKSLSSLGSSGSGSLISPALAAATAVVGPALSLAPSIPSVEEEESVSGSDMADANSTTSRREREGEYVEVAGAGSLESDVVERGDSSTDASLAYRRRNTTAPK